MTNSLKNKHPQVILKAERQKQLVGLRGWLAFFIVSQIIALAITIFNFFNDGFISSLEIELLNEYQSGLGDTLQVASSLESLALVVYIALISTTLVLLFRKLKLAKPFAIATLAFGAAYNVVDYLAITSVLGTSELSQEASVRTEINQAAKYVGRAVFAAALWIPYFLVSKRVALTLQEPREGTNSNHHSSALSTPVLSTDEFARRAVKYVALAIGLITILGLLVLSSGGALFSTWEKTDREYKAETYRTEYTGKNNVLYSGEYICVGGQDYQWCVNQHVANYNSSCANQILSTSASETCDKLLTFINETKSRLWSCGYNCRTIAGPSGNWGWQYLRLSPETQQISNNDAQEKVTHTAICVARVGNFKIGECQD